MGGFSVNTNIASLQSQQFLRVNSDLQQKTIGRVSSGLRILSSGDDAAGLAIANGLRSDQAVLSQGIRNANDGLSQLQIIDGGINNISKLLDRARTLATQSASGTFTGSRAVLNSEFGSVVEEIDRQAQSIGLDTGGSFARSIAVFIGGGRGNAGISAINNGSVSVNLANSTVDSRSLGLSGVRAASITGTDLSTSSATTSVQQILADSTNTSSLAVGGFSDFFFRGAGFSDDGDRIRVSPNLSGITNTNTLVEALNIAIESAGNGGTAAATAFKNANIKALVVNDAQLDGSVKERLGFISSTGAFQVAAGDRLSNALLGNYSSGAAGKSLTNTFAGGVAASAGATTFAGTANVILRIQGGGLAATADITLSVTVATTVTQALASLTSQVAANAALSAAGITVDTAAGGSNIVFSNSRGEPLEVLASGDTANLLGLGSFRLATATSADFDYTSVTGAAGTFAAAAQTLEFSIAGGPKVALAVTPTAATVAGAIIALNAAFNANSTTQAAGLVASLAGAEITIASAAGTAFRVNALGAANVFGFGLNGAAFAGNLTSAIVGTNTSTAAATTDTVNDILAISINGTTTNYDLGTNADAAAVVATLNANGTFTGNGLRAALVNNAVAISHTNAETTIQIETAASLSANTALGYTTGTNSLTDKATVNSGGAFDTELGTNAEVFSYRRIRNGSDDQTITITATDSSGAQNSLSVVLRNDAVGRSGNTLDQALTAINTALQQSGNITLKKIVAVKEQNFAQDAEGFRFLSTISQFRVSLGVVGTSTATNEIGAFDNTTGTTILGQGTVTSATQSTGGSQLDISNLSGAQNAVTALATAISSLGDAQAVVGRGQNQFNFAVNLAQSQLTNLAASESRIRDADLAAEAANLTKAQIVLQAGIAALAQANSAPQAVLGLLRG